MQPRHRAWRAWLATAAVLGLEVLMGKDGAFRCAEESRTRRRRGTVRGRASRDATSGAAAREPEPRIVGPLDARRPASTAQNAGTVVDYDGGDSWERALFFCVSHGVGEDENCVERLARVRAASKKFHETKPVFDHFCGIGMMASSS